MPSCFAACPAVSPASTRVCAPESVSVPVVGDLPSFRVSGRPQCGRPCARRWADSRSERLPRIGVPGGRWRDRTLGAPVAFAFCVDGLPSACAMKNNLSGIGRCPSTPRADANAPRPKSSRSRGTSSKVYLGQFLADFTRDIQEEIHVARAEAIVAPVLENDRPPWALPHLVRLIDDTSFSPVADRTGFLRHNQTTRVSPWRIASRQASRPRRSFLPEAWSCRWLPWQRRPPSERRAGGQGSRRQRLWRSPRIRCACLIRPTASARTSCTPDT